MNAPPPRRSGALWTVAIGLLVFGLAGCACNSLGVASSVVQSRVMHGMDEAGLGADAETDPMIGGPGGMMDKMEKWANVTLGLSVGALLFSTVVMVCGVLVLTWNTSVPRSLPIMLGVVVLYTVLETGITLWSQYDMMSWTQDLAGSAGAGATGFNDVMGATMGFSACMAGGWAFLKIAFYVYAATHVRKPEVAMLFGGQAPAIGPRGD